MANSYNNGFHTLMSEAGILSRESFETYIKDVIGFGNIQKLDLDGFTWDDYSSITFDFKELLLSNRVKVMATYADKDSEVIPLGSEGFKMTEGVIPCIKARYIWDADDYRRYLDALSKITFQGGSAQSYARDLLFASLNDMRVAHELSMTYQRDQLVSNRKLELDANNNPRGIKGLVFEVAVPADNISEVTVAKRWFSSATEKTAATANENADPVGDLKKIIRKMVRKGYAKSNIFCEVDEVSFFDDMEHPAWRTAIGYSLRRDLVLAPNNDANALAVGNNATDDETKAAFARILGIPLANIKFKQGLTAVEKLDGKGPDAKLTRTEFRTFNTNVYVFYPGGPLGKIKTAMALLPDDSAMYATFFGGRGIIQYEYDKKSKMQDWWSEFYGICVPLRPQEMFYMITFKS